MAAEDAWTDDALPLLREFCIDCHGADVQEAEVNLSSFLTPDSLHGEATLWKEVLKRIEFGAMPPEDAMQPSKEQRKKLIQTVEQALYGSSCDLEPKPGRVTVRRLNRNEYNNTIQDLFKLDMRPADAFPSDEVGAGFDNNGDVLSLPPMLLEKYVQAAERIASKAIVDPDSLQSAEKHWEGDAVTIDGKYETNRFERHELQSDATVSAEFELPYAGYYGFNVQAAARKKGQELHLEALLDGKPIGDMKFNYRGGDADSDHEWIGFKTSKGKHKVVMRLRRDKAKGVDSFRFTGLKLEGPKGVPESEASDCHWALVRHRPQKGKRSAKQAAAENLKPFLQKLFRQEVDDATVDRYASLAELADSREATFERSMQIALTGALVSPKFLFRSELPQAKVEPGAEYPLDNYQLASRLSYFFWSSTPDDHLLKLAEQGKVNKEQTLRSEVKRMIYDRRGERMADNFAAQWLGLRILNDFEPDPTQFDLFSEDLRNSMLEETRLTFLDCMRGGQTVLNLLDSTDTFLDQRLAKHYGIKGVEGVKFRKTSLKDTGRSGILTQASVLMLTSNPTRTSPVKRGKWVMENILGTPPPDPPAGIPELDETATSNPDAPIREQLAIHRDNAMCASCHRQMDAIGFSFENFDAIGRWREKDGKHKIDASGTLPDGDSFSGAQELAKLLREKSGRMFVSELTRRLMSFGLGRELNHADRCVVNDIVDSTEKDGWKFLDIATAVVLSKPFRYQTAE